MNTVMLLDSNIFLEVELAEQHAEACRHLLDKVRDGVVKSAITDFHVDSIVVVMENYGKGWSNIAPFLASPLHYKGLTVYMNLGSRIRASSHMKDYGLDFDDALASKPSRIFPRTP